MYVNKTSNGYNTGTSAFSICTSGNNACDVHFGYGVPIFVAKYVKQLNSNSTNSQVKRDMLYVTVSGKIIQVLFQEILLKFSVN